ncbi:MAG: tRNA (N(6)-L-threonylcarbamoyladenosine(37)-C(2))-methylthiotransferase MtaB [Lentisphaeria bacterium]|nr:tRNA (N(6)-L-threonylcarbamoyladenosine(37)-C(2))-methylthiotransferase MtaB [Lentisphaeria bacterium]
MKHSMLARIVTLGCRLNHADSALLMARLQNLGYTLTDDETLPCELIVVNSCAVTAEAEAKSRRMISRLRRENPGARIAAAGCAAEINGAALLNSGADLVLTNPDKKLLGIEFAGVKSIELPPENFAENSTSVFPFRTRAFVKVQEGCDNFCSYCIVPYVRGPSRSRDFAESVADCRQCIGTGIAEVVLTGVNTCNYNDNGKTLADLIRAVAALPGDFRIRLSSTEPHPGDMTIPELMAESSRLCRFLHLSMQHGSDRILQLMKRRYTARDFAAFVADIRKLVPDIHIGTDFIVGFPGETEADFNEALLILQDIGFANIHAFAYSPRPGTPAAAMKEKVPAPVVKERMVRLRELAERSARDFACSQVGKKVPVIFERCDGGFARGWSDNYLEVSMPQELVQCGRIIEVEATAGNLQIL